MFKQTFKIFSITAVIVLFFTIGESNAQANNTKIVNSLNSFIIPIQTINPDSSFSDLNILKQSLKDKQIVSLGEAANL